MTTKLKITVDTEIVVDDINALNEAGIDTNALLEHIEGIRQVQRDELRDHINQYIRQHQADPDDDYERAMNVL